MEKMVCYSEKGFMILNSPVKKTLKKFAFICGRSAETVQVNTLL